MSGGLHEALEDLMACMTWHVSHMVHHVSWTMPVRITWRARALPWEGRKDSNDDEKLHRLPRHPQQWYLLQ